MEDCKGVNMMMESVSTLTTEVHQTLINLWREQCFKDALPICRYKDHIFDGAE
jgi:hypothetical protein